MPPHLPPNDIHSDPMISQMRRGVVVAGASPKRKSTARAGHRVWSEFGADGLRRSCKLGDRRAEMIVRPAQRIRWAENLSLSLSERTTSICARAAEIVNRLCSRHGSLPMTLENDILA